MEKCNKDTLAIVYCVNDFKKKKSKQQLKLRHQNELYTAVLVPYCVTVYLTVYWLGPFESSRFTGRVVHHYPTKQSLKRGDGEKIINALKI